jgi:hypothetical protein
MNLTWLYFSRSFYLPIEKGSFIETICKEVYLFKCSTVASYYLHTSPQTATTVFDRVKLHCTDNTRQLWEFEEADCSKVKKKKSKPRKTFYKVQSRMSHE